MYEQSLYKVIQPIKLTTINRLNKGKKWKYGYDKDSDVVVISKSGQIGEILEIQGLKIALPKVPKDVFSCVSFLPLMLLKKLKLDLTGKIILKSLKKSITVT
jgi:hypothetical protein